MNMAIIVPSRGRPQNISRLRDQLMDTEYQGHLIVGLDEDDSKNYTRIMNVRDPHLIWEVNPRLRLAGTLNLLATKYADQFDVLAFLGDDHFPEGEWERPILEELADMRTGFVYGDDGHQGPNIPTAVFLTSNIVKALGYMVPRGMQHMYLDNIWKDLGEGAGCIRYLPHVKITHLHPNAGKAEWDGGYEEVNSAAQYSVDLTRYTEWRQNEMAVDISKIKDLING